MFLNLQIIQTNSELEMYLKNCSWKFGKRRCDYEDSTEELYA